MPYRFRDDIATADAAFDAWGRTREELFISACEAVMNVMVEDTADIRPVETREIALEDDQLDMLLFQLLQELIFYKDAENLLLRVRRLEIRPAGRGFALHGEARGEPLDPERHDLLVDVKAVTLHRYRVEQTDRGWEATVVVDI